MCFFYNFNILVLIYIYIYIYIYILNHNLNIYSTGSIFIYIKNIKHGCFPSDDILYFI